jgi:CBS domain-containing protein
MNVGQHCSRNVAVVDTAADIVTAAKLMRTHHVGFLVVLDARNAERTPVGVITDRDLVIQVYAKEIDPSTVKVGDVMTRNPVVASEIDDLTELVKKMQQSGIRRLPLVNATGAVSGVIALDDVIEWLAALLCDVTGLIITGQRAERRARSA